MKNIIRDKQKLYKINFEKIINDLGYSLEEESGSKGLWNIKGIDKKIYITGNNNCGNLENRNVCFGLLGNNSDENRFYWASGKSWIDAHKEVGNSDCSLVTNEMNFFQNMMH